MAVVTPEEVLDLSPGEVITLYLNRTNHTDFTPAQLDHVSSQRLEDENGPYVEVVVEPTAETGWKNGPITVKMPVFDVGAYYHNRVISIPYAEIKRLGKLGTYLRRKGAPPSRTLRIVEGEVNRQEDGTDKLSITYFAEYNNIFFTGHLPVRVTDVPELVTAIKVVNDVMLNKENLN